MTDDVYNVGVRYTWRFIKDATYRAEFFAPKPWERGAEKVPRVPGMGSLSVVHNICDCDCDATAM